MPLPDQVRDLADEILGQLDKARGFYLNTRQAWRVVQQVAEEGRGVGILDGVIGQEVPASEMEVVGQHYVSVHLAVSVFKDLSGLLEDWITGPTRLWLTTYPVQLDAASSEAAERFDRSAGRRSRFPYDPDRRALSASVLRVVAAERRIDGRSGDPAIVGSIVTLTSRSARQNSASEVVKRGFTVCLEEVAVGRLTKPRGTGGQRVDCDRLHGQPIDPSGTERHRLSSIRSQMFDVSSGARREPSPPLAGKRVLPWTTPPLRPDFPPPIGAASRARRSPARGGGGGARGPGGAVPGLLVPALRLHPPPGARAGRGGGPGAGAVRPAARAQGDGRGQRCAGPVPHVPAGRLPELPGRLP